MTNWQSVWENRSLDEGALDPVAEALRLNGYDSPTAGNAVPSAFAAIVKEWGSRLGITRSDSVYEVGCGAGAFLALVRSSLGVTSLSGSDRSHALISAGQRLFPDFQLSAIEASEFPVLPEADHCVAFGVFMYFESQEYAAAVLERMMQKGAKSVSLFDVPDMAKRHECEEFRAQSHGSAALRGSYADLTHQYFDKDWIRSFFPSETWRVEISDQHIDGYLNSDYRFNVIAMRR